MTYLGIGGVIVAFLAAGLDKTMFPFFSALANGLFSRHHKKIEAAAQVAAKEAIDGTAVLTSVFARVGALEARCDMLTERADKADERADKADAHAKQVEKFFCEAYVVVHEKLMGVAALLRGGEAIETHVIDDIEKTPDIKAVKKRILDECE